MKTFAQLATGDRFRCQGNEYIKRSTKTALLVNFNKVFYFYDSQSVEPLDVKLKGANNG